MMVHDHDPRDRPSTIPWPPILLAALLVASWLLGRVIPLTWPGLDDTAARAVGLAFGAAGLFLLVWAIVTLLRHQTTVLPHAGATRLVTDGPYARFRNPIYLADILILFGLAEVTKNVWFAIAAPLFGVLVTWLAILPEERHLAAKFGEAWHTYASKTRRLI